MGTGIVSIAVGFDGRETLSRLLLGAAAGAWVALGLLLVGRALREPGRLRREARSPAGLSGVAATAVLGTRVTVLGWPVAGAVMLAIAFALWAVLIPPVLAHWVTPTVGISLMLAVSTESLAVLSATIADVARERWLLDAALAPFVLGLAFYVFVMARFDRRQLTIGCGDQWIAGGAVAISTLAAGDITVAANALQALDSVHSALKALAVTVWVVTVAWLPVLIGMELLRPRLRYDARRWSTVFPVGMYAACSYVIGATASAPAIVDFARAWTWAAFAVWLVVTAGTLRRGVQVSRLPRRS
jgi:tellurite resistance protein TehA-like permease